MGRMFRRKRRTSRKRFRRKSRGPSKCVVRGSSIVPDRYFVKLHYNTFETFNTAAAAAGAYVMSQNSCYDPDVTGTGHQPRGFDQLAALYNRYVVHKSRCTVAFGNEQSASFPGQSVGTTQAGYSQHIQCSVYPTDRPTAVDTTEPYETRYAKIKTIATAEAGTKIVSNSIKTKKLAGIKVLDDTYQGATGGGITSGTDPARQYYWIIYAIANDRATEINAEVNIRMTYWVEFFEPNQLGIS